LDASAFDGSVGTSVAVPSGQVTGSGCHSGISVDCFSVTDARGSTPSPFTGVSSFTGGRREGSAGSNGSAIAGSKPAIASITATISAAPAEMITRFFISVSLQQPVLVRAFSLIVLT
jgi:hypothetical protein